VKPQYEPKSLTSKLGYLVEECGEVLAAAGKSLRWGLESVNPEIPPEQQETNRDWLLRELVDLDGAIQRVRAAVGEGPSVTLKRASPIRENGDETKRCCGTCKHWNCFGNDDGHSELGSCLAPLPDAICYTANRTRRSYSQGTCCPCWFDRQHIGQQTKPSDQGHQLSQARERRREYWKHYDADGYSTGCMVELEAGEQIVPRGDMLVPMGSIVLTAEQASRIGRGLRAMIVHTASGRGPNSKGEHTYTVRMQDDANCDVENACEHLADDLAALGIELNRAT
jgi:hypothetical protein